jgi:hypothetical protein
MPVNISLAAMLPVALAIFAVGKAKLRRFSITFATLLTLDLAANLMGLGAFFWWSPLHWPSTMCLGVDEIVEEYGVTVTTIGYILDILIWSILITGVVQLMKKKAPNQASHATSEPAPGAASSSREG